MLTTFAAGQLFAERFGTNPPTVLALHGWGRDRKDFSAVLADLDAFAVDLPGFGVSPAPAEVWGTSEYADTLLPILKQCSASPILVGHSFGGRVAVRAAAKFPDLIGGLVLTGVPLVRLGATPSAPPLVLRVSKALRRRHLASEDFVERLRDRYGSADYRAAHGIMRKILVRVVNETYEEDLRRIRCRIEMVWGSTDKEASPELAKLASKMIANSGLEILPDIGHLLPVSAPLRLRAAVDRLREFYRV
jgi:pimeloyl-ACP methyl ester carboxylesterase